MEIAIFWFRRDLRLHDNTGLNAALSSGQKVLPIFIFDENITTDLDEDDPRLSFIYENLKKMNSILSKSGSGILIEQGDPSEVWEKLIEEFSVGKVFFNKDYEPYATNRDQNIVKLFKEKGIEVESFKDQVIFEENEILQDDGAPYTLFTPFKSRWLQKFNNSEFSSNTLKDQDGYFQFKNTFPALEDLFSTQSSIQVKDFDLSNLERYGELREFPAEDAGSYLGPHLRFGTVSIREIFTQLNPDLERFKNELIRREFYQQILFHFPKLTKENFKAEFNGIRWRFCLNNYDRWCSGKTGYPLVDAGIRQLNSTGYMHHKVRMIAAEFLCKHLLIDWGWGAEYFAEKLLDFDLASNIGNWQKAAGTGCDTVPFKNITDPNSLLEEIDKDLKYIKKWLPEFGTARYPKPIIEHEAGRERAIKAYDEGLQRNQN